MYCWNYTGTISCVLCREVYYTVSLFGRVHYLRCHCVTHTLVYDHSKVRTGHVFTTFCTPFEALAVTIQHLFDVTLI
jgi:hypothetical protein